MTILTKIRIGILFGGKSAEHNISLQSALNVINAIDKKKYDITMIGIDKRGQWYVQEPLPSLPNQQPTHLTVTNHLNDWVTLVPGQNHALLTGLMTKEQVTALDVIFPVVHGPYAEDGTIQGLMRLANLPFVGSDVLSSAICMDKDMAKRLVRDAGIPTPNFITLRQRDLATLNEDQIIKTLGLPCFVKPANMGSSIGISKVTKKADLRKAIDEAMSYDFKVIIEEAIIGREIECGILGNDEPLASVPGEIIPHAEFYTYDAKYNDPNGAEVVTVADLPPEMSKKVQALAIKIFQTLDCDGMARVDFFLKKDGTLLFNEINTIPGFTHISQYPKMWEATGIGYTELIDRLVQLAMEKFDHRQSIKTAPDH
ncbi:MAG: D-alanine--D-alanine ligase [Legionellales bacterium]|nr:D-alanine--D-alanine ligase [Legionellales bacterium]